MRDMGNVFVLMLLSKLSEKYNVPPGGTGPTTLSRASFNRLPYMNRGIHIMKARVKECMSLFFWMSSSLLPAATKEKWLNVHISK